MPKATVKLEQTQPLPQPRQAAVKTAGAYQPQAATSDSLGLPLSIVAFLGSLGALAVQLMTFLSKQ